MTVCKWCRLSLTQCRMDARGICIKDPKSSGVEKKRTRREKKRDAAIGS